MPKTVNVPRPADGEVLYDVEEKVFEDIRANPGEQAFVFIHSVPYECSVALVNLLTATRLVRKGFDVKIVLYGPGVLPASAPPAHQHPDQAPPKGGAADLPLPVRHGRPLRLPGGRPDRRHQAVQP